MTTQTIDFIVTKNAKIIWDDDCGVCPCGMWINSMTLSSDETRLVIYLKCPNCWNLRVVVIEPVEYAPHTVSGRRIHIDDDKDEDHTF